MKRNEDYTHYPTQIDPKKDKTKGDWVAGDPPEPVSYTHLTLPTKA